MTSLAPELAVRVDPALRALIPPLSTEERALLEINIRRDGCRDPLVIWGDVLLDGHHRFEICHAYNLPFRTIAVNLNTREDAEDWIDANQLGRRNLTPEQASLLRGRRYNRTKQSHGGQIPGSSSGQNVQSSAECLADQHGVTERTIRRDGDFAAAVETLKIVIPDIEERVLAGDVPSKQAVLKAAREQEDAIEILSRPHVSHNSGNNEWYTPEPLIEAARGAMGQIDVDPASSKIANKRIQAKTFYTADDDGLTKPWRGNVWMNPPYAQPLVAQFADAVSEKFDSKEIKAACVLVNNATETTWFQRMLVSASAVCFLRGRVRFLDPCGEPTGAPLQGQAVLYFGKNPLRFVKSFSGLGCVLVKPD